MATTEELLIKLKADNTDLRNKLSQSSKDVQGFQGQIQKLSGLATVSFAAMGVAVGAFMRQSYLAYEQQEKANRRLLFALDGNKAAFNALTLQANKFQSTTGIADDKIQQIQTLAAQAGKSTAEIKKITEATINWASVTGQDLQAAYLQINGTLTGTAGRLTRVDADFAKLSETQLRNGGAIDLINQKYKGFAENSASALEKLSANWDEFSESVGGGIANVINPALESMNNAMTIIQNRSGGFWNKLGSALMLASNNPAIMAQAASISSADAVIAQNEAEKELEKTGEKRKKQIIETTNETKKYTEAVDQWVAAYEKSLYLQQYDVPQIGQFAGITMGSATGKGLTIGKKSLTPRQGESPLGGAIDLTNKQLDEQIGLVNDLSGAFLDMAASGEMSMQSLSLTVLAAIRKIITAKLAEAIASQIASGSSKGLPGLALAAIGISAVMGMFSKIPKFETGGIVGGSSFSGDSITARVNSGEMILNASQQAQLFAMANGQAGGGTLVTKISANDLYFMVKRGEYLAGRNGRR